MALASIGSLGTSTSSLYQSVSGGAQSSTLTSIWNPQPPRPDADTPEPQQDTLRVRRSDDHSLQQLEAAVGSALDAAQQNPIADPNQIIQDAVQQAFRTDALASFAGAANSNSNATSSATGSDGDTDPDTSTATQSFLQALRTYGVDPQQFHSDLVSAVKDAQHGHVDPSTVFRSFPVGSSLDAVA